MFKCIAESRLFYAFNRSVHCPVLRSGVYTTNQIQSSPFHDALSVRVVDITGDETLTDKQIFT